MARLLFACLALAAPLFAVGSVDAEEPSMTPPIVLRTQLLDRMEDFAQRNGIDLPLREDQRDFDAMFFQAKASDSTAGGYVVRFEDPSCSPVVLPAGRMVTMGHIALWLTDLSAVVPMAPLPFEDARRMADDLDAAMRAAGWERILHRPEYSPQSIADKPGANFHTLARYGVDPVSRTP